MVETRLFAIVILLLGAVDVANIFSEPIAANAKQVDGNDDVEQKSSPSETYDEWSAANQGVKISYCTSCAMKGAFMQVKQYVEREFPGTPIIGETYPIAPQKELMKKALVVLQIGTAAMVMAGEQILNAVGVKDPSTVAVVVKLKEKKFPVLMGTWVLGNMVQNGLSSTGAFEVYSSGQKIFSKLDSGRLPGLEELYDGLVRTLTPAVSQTAL